MNLKQWLFVREYCDKKDVYYVYKMNDHRGKLDKPSYVFKSSKTKAEIALNMDKNGNNVLNEEFRFFEGKHRRCKGFITLTASMHNALLCKQIALTISGFFVYFANCKLWKQSAFFEVFNKILRKVLGDNLKEFYPIGWCTDMVRANMAGVVNVFGEDSKQHIKSCEFYFKDHWKKFY